MSCDLHSHTNASDGEKTPEQVVCRARELGLSAVAITDHDTVAAVPAALREGLRIGQKVIPGVELSTREEERTVHLVGLYIDPSNPGLAERLAYLRETRRERNRKILERLAQVGIRLDPGRIRQIGEASVTRVHIAGMLVEQGYGSDVQEAMGRYLLPGGPGYIRRESLAPQECIAAIHAAGGLAFVAHINQIDRRSDENCLNIARKMLALGADGIETRHGEYRDGWQEKAEKLAKETGCLCAGGSDYHGAFKKGLELGTGRGDLSVPDAFWKEMEKKLGH